MRHRQGIATSEARRKPGSKPGSCMCARAGTLCGSAIIGLTAGATLGEASPTGVERAFGR